MDILPRNQSVLTQDHIRNQVGGAAEVAYADRFVAEVHYFLNPRLGHEEEHQFVLGHHEELDGSPSYGGRNPLRHGDRIVQISGAESVHRYGERDPDVFGRKTVLGIESFLLGNNGGQETGRARRYADTYFVLRPALNRSEQAYTYDQQQQDTIRRSSAA